MKRTGTKYSTSILAAALLIGSVLIPFTAQGARIAPAEQKDIMSTKERICCDYLSTDKSTSLVVAPRFPFNLLTGVEALAYQQEKPDTTIAVLDPNAPSRMFLDQNYPNPFRDATSIRYGIPRNSIVTVTIHTLLGSPVKTLVSERQKGGIYTLNLSKPDLMPGLYFYRLQTEYGTLTRRFTIAD